MEQPPCQADSHLNTQISQQSATAAAGTIIQNINTIIQISEGEIDPQSIGGTLLADTKSAILVYQQWQKYNASILNQKISSLKLEISSVQSLFNRTPTAQLDDALSASLKAVDDLEDAQRALLQNARAAGKLGTTLKAIKFLGAGASGLDTILKANDLINAIQDDASNFDKGMAASKAAVSASVTGMVFAGAKLNPLVGTVYVATDVAVWYTGKLGDAVYLETNSRTAAIYNDINGANLRIQNRISALYKSPPPPTDEQVAAIAREEYASVRQFVEGFKEDVGVIEWLFGVNKSSNDAIDDALAMVDYILDNKAEERAISFNNNLREQWDAYNNLLNNLESTTDILGGIENSIPENRLITRSSDPVLDDDDDDNVPVEDDDTDQEDETDTSDRTDDEIAAEEEAARIAREEEDARLALERANQISALEIERTAQFEVKVDREANIANNNDRLAILEHGELGTVQNALSLVVSSVNDMRQDLIDGNLSPAEQQRFQDLAAYQETLEGEIDRINTEITTLTNTNQTLQSELDSANITIINNSDQLNALNYDYNNFTEPTFTGTLTDWSNYEYELPPFNETETPTGNLVGVFSGVNGTPSSNLAIQGVLTNITETSTGNASFEIAGDCVSGCTVTGTTPEPEASSYSHLSWGRLSQTVRMTDTNTGITHDIQNMRWLYGDATSSDYLNTRTGTASYAGQIYADFTEAGVTQYNAVTGGIGLSFNFSDDSLSGQAYLSLGGVPQEGFDIAGGLVNFDGQQHLRADLTSQDPDTSGSITSGGLLGTFYGPEANEVGGAIWAFGTASEHDEAFAVGGVFVASSGETFVMPDIYYGATHTRVTANKVGFGVYDTDTNGSSGFNLDLPTRVGGGAIIKTETFAASGYSYSSWGKWTADSGNINPDYVQGGYWSETQTTPASVVQNRTGTASYSGNIVGDFVSNAGVRDDARGLININADFSNQSVSGQMQFGHDCGGGSGPSGCNVISGVASFNEAINDYNGSGFGSHSDTVRTTGSGVVGIFAGPNAEEIAGTAWMNDNGGLYNGAFIAGQ